MLWAAGMRWSYSERAWVGLFRPMPDGRLLLRYEQTFYHRSPETAAAMFSSFVEARKCLPAYIVGNAELFPKSGEHGETISETVAKAGMPLREGSGDRLALWSRLRSWLEPRDWNGVKSPSLLIHADCKYLIRTLPTLVKSDTEPDDVDETPDEYPAMGVALFAMSRPSPWQRVEEKKPINPLSGAALWKTLRDGENNSRYLGWNRRSSR